MKVFFDTSAFVALLVSTETHHAKVSEKYKEYRGQRAAFVTSPYILDELFTRLLYYPQIDIKKQVQNIEKIVEANELTILQIDGTLFEKTTAAFVKFSGHKISFTDATSYVLMREFALDEIFTLDSDFKKIGLKTSF